MRDFVMTAALAAAVVAIAAPAEAQLMDRDPALILVTGPVAPAQSPANLSAEEKMQRRYPQPVKVGDLIGLPVLDDDDRTLGRVKSVVRTRDGNIRLIVGYGGFLGFGQRPVAVPIEVVAIAARQLASLDMPRAEFDAAPTWTGAESQSIAPGETIRIGLYRR